MKWSLIIYIKTVMNNQYKNQLINGGNKNEIGKERIA